MQYYKDLTVYISGEVILARSASISNSNDIQFSNTAGQITSIGFPNGGITSAVSLEYRPLILKDPVLNEIISFKNQYDLKIFPTTISPTVLQIGQISGSYFLNNASLSLEVNSTLLLSTSFISYHPISGNGIPQNYTGSVIEGSKYLANANEVNFINQSKHKLQSNIYSFEYEFSKNISPIYALGNKYPIETALLSAEEKTSLAFDSYKEINFTGQLIDDLLENHTRLNIVPQNFTQILSEGINLNLSSQIIDSIKTSSAENQIMSVTVQAKRKF